MKSFICTVLVLLAVLVASPAASTNYHPVNWVELAGYATAALPGDTIFIEGNNSYNGTLAPAAGNTLQPIVFIGGDLNNPSATEITDLTPNSHNRFYGIQFTSGVDLGSNKRRIVLDHCILYGGLDYKDADSSSVRWCTIGGTDFSVNHGAGNIAQSDTLESSTFSSLNATGWYPILYGITDSGIGYVDKFVRRFNVFNISQGGSTAYTPVKHFKTSNLLSYGNKFIITSTATGVGSKEGDFGMVFRDSSYNLTMRRDTLFFNNEGATISTYGLLYSSGMGGAYATSLTGHSIDSCYVRVFRGDAVYLAAQATNLKMRYNVFRSRLGTALLLGSAFQGSSNDPYIHHNTLLGSRALHYGELANTGGRVSNNILWGTSSATCAEGTAVAACSNEIPVAISDSNFVYSTTGDSTRSFYYTGGCLAPRAGAWAARPNDTHSYWGDPHFADSSWANLDPTPPAGNFARTSNFTLNFAGARNASNSVIALSAFRADVKDYTAGLSLTLANDSDSTATVSGFYDVAYSDSMPAWVRLPGQNKWYTSLFGLTPGGTYNLRVVASRAGTTITFDTTITTRQAQWWTSTGYGPDVIHVAPLGHDTTGTGSYDLPYRTINRAWYVLTHRQNYGRGGIIWLHGGTYYSTGYLSGGYATPDSMYSIMAWPGETPIIDGADERYLTGSALTWTQIGATGVWKAYCAAMDSVAGVWTNDMLALKASTPTELHALAGTSVGGSWTNENMWYTNGMDSLYIHSLSGSSPSPFMLRLLYRQKLLVVYTPYVRVSGITFTHAGGANPFALQIGTGAGAYRANGAVVDHCTFVDNGKQGLYSHTGADLNADSVVVADCNFYITDGQGANLGYNATKGHAEENIVGLSAAGASWLITNNTFTGFVNAVGFGEIVSGDSISTSGDDLDLRDNTITNTADDGLELDYSRGHNAKVYRNVFSGAARGISMAPCYEGPMWILFNKISNPGWEAGQDGVAFKFGTGEAGHSRAWALIANNTVWTDSLKNASSVGEAGSFQNKHFRNNIFVGKDTWLPIRNTGSATCNVNGTDFNYNLLWTWGGGESVADWQGISRLMEAWQDDAGFDHNGLQANPQFTDLAPSLLKSRGGKDLGMRITGISGKLIPLNGLPDIGASEYSSPAVSARRRHWLSVWLGILKRSF